MHGGQEAYYRPSTDTIHMPDEHLFTGTDTMTRSEAYFAVLAHEHVHYTGHPSRLDRNLANRFGDAEELVAMKRDALHLAARLSENAEAICKKYLSQGRPCGHYWLVGDASASPVPRAFRAAAGKWTDAATGEHGDLLDLIALNRGHTRLRDTLEEARAFLGEPPHVAPRYPPNLFPATTQAPPAGSFRPRGRSPALWRKPTFDHLVSPFRCGFRRCAFIPLVTRTRMRRSKPGPH